MMERREKPTTARLWRIRLFSDEARKWAGLPVNEEPPANASVANAGKRHGRRRT